MSQRKPSIYTLSVHAGETRSVRGAAPAVPPIVPSVGYVHPSMQDTDAALGYSGGTPFDPEKYVYARHGAINQSQLENAVAELEGAESAVAFSSGMAALFAVIASLSEPGDTIVAAEQLYGATRSLLVRVARQAGLHVRFVDFLDIPAATDAIRAAKPAVVLCEVLTNPLVHVIAVDRVVDAAREAGARFVVDNTFASPYLMQPLSVGADIVVHSTTKFINGHGDVMGGIVVGRASDMQAVFDHRKLTGAFPGAFDAWLTLRGLRTFALRMKQACSNASVVAAWLNQHPRVSRVNFPGLPSDSGHMDARRLFRADTYGSMIAFEIAGLDRAGAFRFVDYLQIIHPVTSLGDIYSLILHPATASHRGLTPEERAAQGISEGLLRLSVGIEDPTDIIDDISRAIEAG